MPLPFLAIKGLAGKAAAAGKKAVGKIAARKGTTAAAKKATTTAKKAGATATLSPAAANFVRTAILGVPGKITGGLKYGAKKIAALRNKAAAKKAGTVGVGVVAGAGVTHHLHQQRQREEQRRQEEKEKGQQVTTFQVHQQRKEEQRRQVEQGRQVQDEIRQDYRRQEEGAFADTEQMFSDTPKIKTIWKQFFPPFIFSLLILLFLFVLSERDRK